MVLMHDDLVGGADAYLPTAPESVRHADRYAGAMRVWLGAEERLREEPPELAGTGRRHVVGRRVRGEPREALTHTGRDLPMRSAQRVGLEEPRPGRQRIDGRVDAQLPERLGQANH